MFRRKWSKIALWFCAVVLIFWVSLGYTAVYIATMPRPEQFADEKQIAGCPVTPVEMTASDGVKLSAWIVTPNQPTDRAVIYMSGILGDRRGGGPDRAKFFLNRGYAALLLDLRGTGKSQVAPVTIGWQERHDLVAAYEFLQKTGYKHIGADGFSLGAATIALGFKELPEQFAFTILESSYDTLHHAWVNRLNLVHVPFFVTLPMYALAPLRLGAQVGTIAPLDCMPIDKSPTLIMGGDSEEFLLEHETRSLYERCGAPLKDFHIFKGGKHADPLSCFPDEYKKVVTDFLDHVEATWTPPQPGNTTT